MTKLNPGQSSSPPPLGDEYQPLRRCTRLLAVRGDGSEVLCDQPAAIHVDWGAAIGFICEAHRPDLTRWSSLQYHDLGPCCGMPGSLWYPEPNICAYADGLPTAEPVRAVAKEVPA